MERGKRKALNFDLDTNEMKKRDMYPKGYSILGGALKNTASSIDKALGIFQKSGWIV